MKPYQMQVSGPWPIYKGSYVMPSQNRFVYVKQNVHQTVSQDLQTNKVHINPNFNKKVFVNPNFQHHCVQAESAPKIHINPHVANVQLTLRQTESTTKSNKIHVNPNVLRSIPVPVVTNKSVIKPTSNLNNIVYASRTRLIRKTVDKSPNLSKMIYTNRRSSICSKYKIIKSSLHKPFLVKNIKYKLIKPKSTTIVKSQYKLDNRNTNKQIKFKTICNHVRKKSLSIKYRSASLLKIGGILYQKLPHSLKRTSNSKKYGFSNVSKTSDKLFTKSKYKIIRRKSANKSAFSGCSTLRKSGSKTKLRLNKVEKISVSPRKLKKCNIPCPIYRKFGRCRSFEKGVCFRKHDPDQIALCTKFLQGACLNDKCLLSHYVSPEKMPTCKYYLEGTCLRDECPYLHVRISPKADVCKNFLEGFCKKAKECDKRHQFLCPDYEKHGKCLKQRCPYPHGKMVRKYSVYNKDTFAKKSSENQKTDKDVAIEDKILIDDQVQLNCHDDNAVLKPRYYAEPKLTPEVLEYPSKHYEKDDQQDFNLRSRPKLGNLPSFIAFQDT